MLLTRYTVTTNFNAPDNENYDVEAVYFAQSYVEIYKGGSLIEAALNQYNIFSQGTKPKVSSDFFTNHDTVTYFKPAGVKEVQENIRVLATAINVTMKAQHNREEFVDTLKVDREVLREATILYEDKYQVICKKRYSNIDELLLSIADLEKSCVVRGVVEVMTSEELKEALLPQRQLETMRVNQIMKKVEKKKIVEKVYAVAKEYTQLRNDWASIHMLMYTFTDAYTGGTLQPWFSLAVTRLRRSLKGVSFDESLELVMPLVYVKYNEERGNTPEVDERVVDLVSKLTSEKEPEYIDYCIAYRVIYAVKNVEASKRNAAHIGVLTTIEEFLGKYYDMDTVLYSVTKKATTKLLPQSTPS